ncbi:hypothetical protein BV25DRAFT_1829880 [Artomyces pyxidatus]|uniref:Uncharacterized protein n=1 Tax=Artomyces pyxidatus TaxID=48021 RepID=A0ACB8SRC3_9AGAM|nr:hypothetical protein BV25DRAFT_1829880 [Artomyces pyxidatus]
MSGAYPHRQLWSNPHHYFPQDDRRDSAPLDPLPDTTPTQNSYPSYPYQTYHTSSSSSSLVQSQNTYPSPTPIVPSQAQYPSFSNPFPDPQSSQSLYGAHGSAQQPIFPPQNVSMSTSSTMYTHPVPDAYPSDAYTRPRLASYPDQQSQSLFLPHSGVVHDSPKSHATGSFGPADTASSAFVPAPVQFQSGHVNAPVNNKRQRSNDPDEDEDEGPGTQGQNDSGANANADKLKRACARCKGLKVRCEFKDDQDICERCTKGGHDCVIPGRKKRRPPPKREVLLTKIREQAAQIEELMAQLEAVQSADRRTSRLAKELPREFAASSSLSSPSSCNHGESVGSVDPTEQETLSNSSMLAQGKVSKENSEWIAEARQKLEAFGGFIKLGGASTSKAYFVEQDFEDSGSSDDEEFAVAEQRGSESDAEESPAPRNRAPREVGGSTGTRKMSSIPSEATPFGLMANLSMKKGKRAASVLSDASDLGVANDDFFRPSPDVDPGRLAIPGHEIPALLLKNIITSAEAERLFKIYFDWMNISVSLLDPVLYTAQQVYWRCPFLFTVICAIASRYDTDRPDLYPTAMEYARQAAGAAFLGGEKRVEVVQAYILLSLYPVPARRWEDDRCWIYLGQGIRMAMDMNLQHPNTAKPRNEQHAREMLNRTRAWLNCFNLDASLGSQYGKTTIIRNTDYVARHSAEWWNSSDYNMENFDIHLCAYNGDLQLLSEFMMTVYSDPNHPTNLNKEIDLEKLATETDDKIQHRRDQWFALLAKTDTSNVQNRFRIGLLKLAFSYARLVVLAFGFQHAFGKSVTEENPFVIRCIRAASDVVSAMVDDIGRPEQRIYVRHGPDAQSVFVAFSCTFLIKLLQPKYEAYISPTQREEIINVVQRAVDFHGSPDISIDERHGPRLYSRFIAGLLESVKAARTGPKRMNRRRSKRQLRASQGTIPEDVQVSQFQYQVEQPAPSEYFAPLKSRPTTPFDHFATYSEGQRSGAVAQEGGNAMGTLGMEASEFFRAPLPFDSEMLQSMQSLSSLSDTQTMLPGFGWMGQMPPLEHSAQRHAGHVPQGYA